MERTVYHVAILIVLSGIGIRLIAVAIGFARAARNRKRFETYRVGWVEALSFPEGPFLAALTVILAVRPMDEDTISLTRAVAAAGGAAMVLYALNLNVWSFRSFPSVYSGHGVLADQQLVTGGAYGFVRHPIYLGVFLIWLGLALSFLSLLVFFITVLYVIPIYVLYMRSEERMMIDGFGDAYRRYCQTVPMLIPRFRKPVWRRL
jgi:protein-S-isoprenylcysteine O-methyltransferase Ste14